MSEPNQFLYYMFHVIGFIATAIFTALYTRKFKVKIWRTVVLLACVYPLVYLFMMLLCWVENGFKNFGGQNIVRIFIWIPLFVLPFAYILKINYRRALNIVAPIPLVIHGVSHFGCIFMGCCCGYPWEYGIYNPALKIRTFPIQPIEAITALLILVAVVFYCYKKKFSNTAKSYSLMLMLFGSTRFMFEFARDNDKLFWGISNLAIHAFVMFIVGFVFFFFVNIKPKPDPLEPEESPAENEPVQEKVETQ